MNIKIKSKIQYSICSCGLSKKLPFCDNEHRAFNLKNGTNYKSVKIKSPYDIELNVSSKTWNQLEDND